MKKSRFRPKVSKIILNPEQAVLSCTCYFSGYVGPKMCTGQGCRNRPEPTAQNYCQFYQWGRRYGGYDNYWYVSSASS